MDDYLGFDYPLDAEIFDLIHYGQEGSYWDFKREWYDLGNETAELKRKAKEDLLHDIICLANNPDLCNAFIVIGVDNKTREIVGVADDSNRRNTEQLIDFLRSKRFVGGTIPVIRVETIDFDEAVDVIVIESTRSVPYILLEDFGKIRAGVVYSRDGATNTPLNRGANNQTMALLWQHRFGLDSKPLDKLLQNLAEKEHWVSTPEPGPERYYLAEAPEYTIEMDYSEYEDRRNISPEFYFFTQTDTSPSYAHCVARYHSTVLLRINVAILDGGRFTTPVPEWGSLDSVGDSLKKGKEATYYGYFIKDSPEWLMHVFLYDHRSGSEETARRRLMRVVPVYENNSERKEFEQYVRDNSLLEQAVAAEEAYVPETVNDYARQVYERQLKVTRAMKTLLEGWRIEKWQGGND